MRDLSSPTHRVPARCLSVAVLALLIVSLALTAAAPGGEKKRPLNRIPFREGTGTSAHPVSQDPPLLRPADLARAAAQAPPAVAALYRALAEPDLEAVPSYERQALKQIDAFLKTAAKELPARTRLQAAETALEVVLRFHLSARDRPLNLETELQGRLFEVRQQKLHHLAASCRGEQDWAEAITLADRLLTIYPTKSSLSVEAARVRTAYAGFKLMTGDFRTARLQLEWIETHFFHDPSFRPLRVNWIYRPDIASIRHVLQDRARRLLAEARQLDDDRAALDRLHAARAAWPRLPGLQDYLLERQHAPRVLYVGVSSLPDFLSPATAYTDPERQAVELLFEGLVRERYDDAQGERYALQLAEKRPEFSSDHSLHFALNHRAYWSNGERLTAKSVRDTVHLLTRPDLPGRTPEWSDLVEPPVWNNDPFHIDFKLRQPALDPLAALTFKVLPPLQRADDPNFAHKPVGSGPFQYAGRRQDGDRTCAVFTANPYYVRAGQTDLPHIREVRFYVPSDPARDFRDPARPLHLLLDLPTSRLKDLTDAGIKDVRTLRNRRVYFLAVNHRIAPLSDSSLRRAFAHALNRQRILTNRFRGNEPGYRLLGAAGGAVALLMQDLHRSSHNEYHRPLNGPYPAGSWAVCPPPQVPADLHDADRARAFARKAASQHKERRPKLEMTLKYPAGDVQAERACQDIADQLAELGESVGWPIHVQRVPLPLRKLREAILDRDYQLAYHHLDYGSEAYWLWPLFDSRQEALEKGGANFLGHEDATLEGLFRAAMGRRDFADMRKATHAIHAHLYETMPLIPLWQLDSHIAVHPSLRPTHLDPLRVFDDVANWKLEK